MNDEELMFHEKRVQKIECDIEKHKILAQKTKQLIERHFSDVEQTYMDDDFCSKGVRRNDA